MSPTGEEPTCPKFQPNIFDPSRCHDCLRQKHLHSGARERAEATPQHKTPAEPEDAAKTQTDSGLGQVEGVALTPIPSQEEERDTNSKVGEKGEEEAHRWVHLPREGINWEQQLERGNQMYNYCGSGHFCSWKVISSLDPRLSGYLKITNIQFAS